MIFAFMLLRGLPWRPISGGRVLKTSKELCLPREIKSAVQFSESVSHSGFFPCILLGILNNNQVILDFKSSSSSSWGWSALGTFLV